MRKKVGIYIHLPFCKRHCFYCHFVTLPYDKETLEIYLNSVIKEIEQKSRNDVIVDSIYLGGGSPSILDDHHFFSIMKAIHDCFNIMSNPEITIECNPEDLSQKKIKIIKEADCNRLSIGVQSFQDDDLLYLRRNHNSAQSLQAISNALNMGFKNVNIDFMIGLPSQTRRSLDKNFSQLSCFDIPHLSCYLLENVPYKNITEKKELDLFNHCRRQLSQLGFSHYEVSNFSKPGFECQHNLKYWQNKDYLGIGLSASGFENGSDYKNFDILDLYLKKIKSREFPVKEIKNLEPATRKIVVGLRLLKGISASSFCDKKKELEILLSDDFLMKRGNRIAVNPDKILLLNEILLYFI